MHSRSAWPFDRSDPDQITEHFEEERYLFLTVVRAARSELHLSFARIDQEDRFGPSPYLETAADLLNTAIDGGANPAVTIVVPAPTPAPEPLGQAWRSSYTLSELAHAALCPYRYSLERLDPAARQYRGAFQTRFLAQAVWLDTIMRRLKASGEQASGAERALVMLLNAMAASRPQLRASFPGFREADWQTVEKYMEGSLDFAAQRAKQYTFSIVDGAIDQIVVPMGQRPVTVQSHVRHVLQVGRYHYPFVEDILREEWLKPGPKPPNGMPQTVAVAGMQVASTQYHAEQWQRNAMITIFNQARVENGPPARDPSEQRHAADAQRSYAQLQADLQSRIAAVQSGQYPKHPGDHCTTCPVRRVCFGREL